MKTLKFETANNGEILEALQNEGADMTVLCETLQTDKSTVAQIISESAAWCGQSSTLSRHIALAHLSTDFNLPL